MITNTDYSWGWLAKLFHWLMFVLIVGAFVAVNVQESFESGSVEADRWMMLHKSFGLTVFVLVWLRLGWRIGQRTVPENFSGYGMAKLASMGHALLYLLMIIVPLSALLMSQFAGRSVSWFGVFDLPVWVAENERLAEQLHELHAGFLAPFLFVLIILHILGGLWHHFIDRDDVLKRMLPFWKGRGL